MTTAEENTRVLQSLLDLADAVARAVALEDVYREALRVVRSALRADRAALLIADDTGVMRFRAWDELSEAYRERTEGHSPWSRAEQNPLPVVIANMAEDATLGELRETVLREGIGALAFIPLVGGEGLTGKIMLCYDQPRSLDESELHLARTIASSVTVAIGRWDVEQQLRASHDQLSAIFDAVADAVTVLDRSGRFVLANDAAAKLCGYETAEEMLSVPTDTVMQGFEIFDASGNPIPTAMLPARRVLAGEPSAEMIVRYRAHGSREDRWSQIKAAPVLRDGAPQFAVSVFRDITREQHVSTQTDTAFTRLSRLERIADVALRASTVDDLLYGLLEVVRAVLESDRATMLLLQGTSDLVVRAAVGISPDVASGVRVPVGEGIAGTIAATRTPTVFDDLSKVEVVSAYLRDSGGSLAGVPLLFQDRLLGVLHVSSDAKSAFDADDLEYLELAGERAAIAIEQARLFERERDIAATLQQSLLPERFPPLPGVTLAASYLPATDGARVGGDWYDAFPLGDGRIMIAIGDIVGHGIEAATAMGQVRNSFRAFASEDVSPASILHRINHLLLADPEQQFCTAFAAILDPWARTITYSDAGHPSPIVLSRTGSARFLDAARSTPLGALWGARYEDAVEPLEPAGLIFAYTDGLIETRTQHLDERLELLVEAATEAASLPVRHVAESVASRLLNPEGTRDDDVAMIVSQITPANDLRLRLPAEPSSLGIIRGALGSFLTRAGATAEDILDLKVACGEACANVIVHAYGTRTGTLRLNAEIQDQRIAISVSDAGRWREHHPFRREQGHGLTLMRALTDELQILTREPAGTEVRMVRSLKVAA